MNYPDTADTFQNDTGYFIPLPTIPPCGLCPQGEPGRFITAGASARPAKTAGKATSHQRKFKKTTTQCNVEQCPQTTPSIASMQPTGNYDRVSNETLTVTVNNVPGKKRKKKIK